MKVDDFEGLDVRLPVEGPEAERNRQPWLLHSMAVNALNFCTFAVCFESSSRGPAPKDGGLEANDNTEPKPSTDRDGLEEEKTTEETEAEDFQSILIASPNGLDQGGIDIFQLPSEHRVCKLTADEEVKTGMVMALSLFHHPISGSLTVLAGYEDGHTIVHVRETPQTTGQPWRWHKTLLARPHSQPILSLDVHPSLQSYFTSGADALVAKFDVPSPSPSEEVITQANRVVNTKHAGQQGLAVRSDGKIFATAGWDARVRIYSTKTLKEVAVLKWHKEGCYAVAFAVVDPPLYDDVEHKNRNAVQGSESTELVIANRAPKSALDVIKEERRATAQRTHWLAAGGKDGKISLWDIY